MASIATVTVRDCAVLEAKMPPPRSIWLSSQPPKISPLALVSAGIARVRMQRSPPGSVSVFSGVRAPEPRSLETLPAGIGREPAAEFLLERAQRRHHIFRAPA